MYVHVHVHVQVERLASGLAHEPAFVAAALDVSGKEASTFVANMLNVDRVPAVLLYPEAARGCLKFLGGAAAIHEGANAQQKCSCAVHLTHGQRPPSAV